MRAIPLLFVDVKVDDVLTQLQNLSDSTKEYLIIFSSMALITMLVAIWAIFFRKRRRRQHAHHHSHHYSHQPAKEAAADANDDLTRPRKRRKWRRPRREHRQRNPTLAETGGLPPIRTGGPPEPRA